MSKEIKCAVCSKYLGTIEPGSVLSKGLRPLCSTCFVPMRKDALSWVSHSLKKKPTTPFGDGIPGTGFTDGLKGLFK